MSRLVQLAFFVWSLWNLCFFVKFSDGQSSSYIPSSNDFWHRSARRSSDSSASRRDINIPQRDSNYGPIRNDHWQFERLKKPLEDRIWNSGYIRHNPYRSSHTYYTSFATGNKDTTLIKTVDSPKVSHSRFPSNDPTIFDSFVQYKNSRPSDKRTSERLLPYSRVDVASHFKQYHNSRPNDKWTISDRSNANSWPKDYRQSNYRYTDYVGSSRLRANQHNDFYPDRYQPRPKHYIYYDNFYSENYRYKPNSSDERDRVIYYEKADSEKRLKKSDTKALSFGDKMFGDAYSKRSELLQRDRESLIGSQRSFQILPNALDGVSCCLGNQAPELHVITDMGTPGPGMPPLGMPPIISPWNYGMGGLSLLQPYHIQKATDMSNGGYYPVTLPHIVSPYRRLDYNYNLAPLINQNSGTPLSQAIMSTPNIYSTNYMGIRKFDEGISLSDLYGQTNPIGGSGTVPEYTSQGSKPYGSLPSDQHYLEPTPVDINDSLDVDDSFIESLSDNKFDEDEENAKESFGNKQQRDSNRVSIQHSNVTFVDHQGRIIAPRPSPDKVIPQTNYHLNYFNVQYRKDGNIKGSTGEDKSLISNQLDRRNTSDIEEKPSDDKTELVINRLLTKILMDKAAKDIEERQHRGSASSEPGLHTHKINIYNSFSPSSFNPKNTPRGMEEYTPSQSSGVGQGHKISEDLNDYERRNDSQTIEHFINKSMEKPKESTTEYINFYPNDDLNYHIHNQPDNYPSHPNQYTSNYNKHFANGQGSYNNEYGDDPAFEIPKGRRPGSPPGQYHEHYDGHPMMHTDRGQDTSEAKSKEADEIMNSFKAWMGNRKTSAEPLPGKEMVTFNASSLDQAHDTNNNIEGNSKGLSKDILDDYPGFGTYTLKHHEDYYNNKDVSMGWIPDPPHREPHDELGDRTTVRAIFWNSRQPPFSFHEHRSEFDSKEGNDPNQVLTIHNNRGEDRGQSSSIMSPHVRESQSITNHSKPDFIPENESQDEVNSVMSKSDIERSGRVKPYIFLQRRNGGETKRGGDKALYTFGSAANFPNSVLVE